VFDPFVANQIIFGEIAPRFKKNADITHPAPSIATPWYIHLNFFLHILFFLVCLPTNHIN
jgi:hypothetical protein